MGPKSDIGQRAKVVWMWANGTSPRDIAKNTGASITTIYRWIRRWKNEGTLESRRDIRQSVNIYPYSGHIMATHPFWCGAYLGTLQDAYGTQIYTWDPCPRKDEASYEVPGNEVNAIDAKNVSENTLHTPTNPTKGYIPLSPQQQSNACDS